MTNKIILTEEESITTALSTVGVESIKTELKKNIEFSQALTVTDKKDKKQVQIIRDTGNGYVKTRNTIKRAFKSRRDKNTQENRDNLEAEREVLLVIEAEEKRLKDIVLEIDLELLKEKNALVLIERQEALAKCECIIEKDLLLVMKEKDFEELLTSKRLEFITIEEARVQAEKEKIAREKELEEAKKQAKIEAEAEAKRQADIEKQRVENEKIETARKQKEELEKVEKEKQDEIIKLKLEQEAKEKLANKKIEDKKQATIEAEKLKQEQIKEENENKKYIEFLKKCGITKENKHEFTIKKNEKTGFREVYKLVDIYKI